MFDIDQTAEQRCSKLISIFSFIITGRDKIQKGIKELIIGTSSIGLQLSQSVAGFRIDLYCCIRHI